MNITWEKQQLLDSTDHVHTYEAFGYDENGNEYTGIVEICCDEIVRVSEVRMVRKRPDTKIVPMPKITEIA